jgi:hypothetical protein|tara:strand:+ start:293 stop:682 length:390 start_codon:yes stop_codon:yes gene_type:complete
MVYLDNHFSIFIKRGATFETAEDVMNQFKADCVSDEISEIMEFNETLLAEGKMTQNVFLVDISGYKINMNRISNIDTGGTIVRVPAGVQIERTYTDEADVIRTWELDKNLKRKINKVTQLAGWEVPFKI